MCSASPGSYAKNLKLDCANFHSLLEAIVRASPTLATRFVFNNWTPSPLALTLLCWGLLSYFLPPNIFLRKFYARGLIFHWLFKSGFGFICMLLEQFLGRDVEFLGWSFLLSSCESEFLISGSCSSFEDMRPVLVELLVGELEPSRMVGFIFR